MRLLCSYEFVGMKETFLLNEFPTLENLVGLVRERLGWMDEGCEVRFEGRIDIGSSNDPRMRTMPSVCNEKEWTTYVGGHNEVRDSRDRVGCKNGCLKQCW
jgi:hypothetical protein